MCGELRSPSRPTVTPGGGGREFEVCSLCEPSHGAFVSAAARSVAEVAGDDVEREAPRAAHDLGDERLPDLCSRGGLQSAVQSRRLAVGCAASVAGSWICSRDGRQAASEEARGTGCCKGWRVRRSRAIAHTLEASTIDCASAADLTDLPSSSWMRSNFLKPAFAAGVSGAVRGRQARGVSRGARCAVRLGCNSKAGA